MWYPPRATIDALERTLRSHEGGVAGNARNLDHFLGRVSARIRKLVVNHLVPDHHGRDWIWIASQFRIHAAGEGDVSRLAGRALAYLLDAVDPEGVGPPDEGFLPELRWVKNDTVARIRSILGRDAIRSFLSSDEMRTVEGLWHELVSGAPSGPELESAVAPYRRSLAEVESRTYLPGIDNVIEELLKWSRGDSGHAGLAGAALRYLIRERDVVPDHLGYLGLVDDIHVLEQAYQLAGEQAVWAPVLDRFLTEWPFIDDLVIDDGSGSCKLSAHLQMACAAVLDCLRHRRAEKRCLVLADPGPAAVLAAVTAVLGSIRAQSDAQRRTLDSLEYGDHVLLADSRSVFKARYLRREDGARVLHWLLLAKGTEIGLPEQTAGLLRRAPRPHTRLSSNAQYARWKKGYRPNPLGHIVGRDVNLDTIEAETLVLMHRNKLDHFSGCLRPLGYTLPALLGVRYVSNTGRVSDLEGGTLRRPLLWACSDPGIARRIRDGEFEGITPKSIIIDSAELADLYCSDASSAEEPVVAVAGQEEWEALDRLGRRGWRPWQIRRRDVRVIGRSRPRQVPEGGGLLVRYMTRQAVRPLAEAHLHEVKNEMVQAIATSHVELRSLAREDPGYEGLSLLSAYLVRKVQGLALEPSPTEHSEVCRIAKQVASRAGAFRNYAEAARTLCDVLAPLVRGERAPLGREAVIRRVISDSSGATGVLVGSRRQASEAGARARGDAILSRARWICATQLQDESPFDVLVVAGWLDRKLMRALRVGGYALAIHYVLFPFERSWEEMSSQAGAARQCALERETVARWEDLAETYRAKARKPRMPVPVTRRDQQAEVAEEEATIPEWLEMQVAERIRRSYAGRPQAEVVQARLVLFDDPGYYALLPPKGRVIDLTRVLQKQDDVAEDETDQGGDAERLILRPVKEIRPGSLLAFPETTNRQLLDELADRLVRDAERTREVAGLWHVAIRECYESVGRDAASIQQLLRSHGIERAPSTILQWIASPHIIAPRRWRSTVPGIADATGNMELKSKLRDVLRAIEILYRARREAAGRLVRQLRAGSVDPESGMLSLEIEGHTVTYRVLRVRVVDAPREFPFDQVGWLHRDPLSWEAFS